MPTEFEVADRLEAALTSANDGLSKENQLDVERHMLSNRFFVVPVNGQRFIVEVTEVGN